MFKDTDALKNVISAASKIMMGNNDEETRAAQTEDGHPIVTAKKAEIEAKAAGVAEEETNKADSVKEEEVQYPSDTSELSEEELSELDTKSYVIDKDGHKGKLVKRLDDGTVEVNIEGEGNVKMSATTWSSKIRKYAAAESYKPQGETVGADLVSHSEFGDGQVIATTQVMEEDEIVAVDVMFEGEIKSGIPCYDLKERSSCKGQNKKVSMKNMGK